MLRNTILIILSILVSSLPALLAAEANSPILRTSQFDQQWLDTVVSIERLMQGTKEVPVGTGFIVSTARNHLLLVTAKHVIQDEKGKLLSNLAYRLNQVGGTSQLLKDVDLVESGIGTWFEAPQHDFAVRFVPVVQGASVKSIPLDRFIEQTQVEAGTTLAALGFPLGLRSVDHALPIARRGMIGRADFDSLLADLFVFPGNSGGPVLYVPAYKTGGISFGEGVVHKEMLVGIVLSYIPYREVAISEQTKHPRVVFEENSGLANLAPAWVLKQFISTGSVDSFDQQFGAPK